MTITDEALTEQIARAQVGSPSDYEWRTWGEDSPRLRAITLQYAARLLPSIRKAQADAWAEGYNDGVTDTLNNSPVETPSPYAEYDLTEEAR